MFYFSGSHGIYNNMKAISLLSEYPEIAKEWDYKKNKKRPEDYAPATSEKVYWICPKGHSYTATIFGRTKRNYGCTICSRKKIVPGVNDLMTLRRDLMKIWDFEKNTILPTEVTLNTNKKVWWRCSDCGCSWSAEISNVTRGHGCPSCRYKKAIDTRIKNMIKKAGSFGEKYPMLLKDWDYERNKGIVDPMKVTSGSSKEVWWKCHRCGHSWNSTIQTRTMGAKCRNCTGWKH